MVKTAYLRVYQPVEVFSDEERRRWLAEPGDDSPSDAVPIRAWLVRAALPVRDRTGSAAEGAFVRTLGDRVLVCPRRTRLRTLIGLLAFRRTVPDEVATAFVSEDEADKAAAELAQLADAHPEVRSHMLHANWHVPLRWFAAFDATERILTEDRHGLRIRYEAPLSEAIARLDRALEILEQAPVDDAIPGALKELKDWLSGFDPSGLLELDYGSVAGSFPEDELAEDRSAQDVWTCLEALEVGESTVAARLFGSLNDRWMAVRTSESMN